MGTRILRVKPGPGKELMGLVKHAAGPFISIIILKHIAIACG